MNCQHFNNEQVFSLKSQILCIKFPFNDEAKLAKILESIRVDYDLHVQLQYNGMALSLTQWFRQGDNAGNTKKSNLFRKQPSVYAK